MTYYPKARGGGSTFHSTWQASPHESNSRHGAPMAVRRGKTWIDNDATRTRGGLLINDHGSPSHAYLKPGTSSRQFSWAQLKDRTYHHGGETFHLRTMAQALTANAHAHVKGKVLGTEVEIKGLGPIKNAMLDKIMVQLQHDAERAYGRTWHSHVIVKVLTDLSGGLPYALRVCEHAHEAGLQTMILARGKARGMRFKNLDYVTYVRGSAVIR